MIKCIWYLKSLKQLLFILLISCFIFWVGCFTSAWYIYKFNTTSTNLQATSFEINTFWKWIPLTSLAWYSKKAIFGSSSTYLFRTEYWIPYSRGWNNWGLVSKYYIYNVSDPSKPFNCTCSEYPCSCTFNMNTSYQYSITSESKDIFANFMSTLNNNDYYYLDNPFSVIYCLYSSSLSKILCFDGAMSHSWHPIANLPDYWRSFDGLNSSLLYDPPSYSQSGGWNWNEWGFDINLSNTYVSSCSRQRAINWYQANWFSSKLCYGGLDNFDIRDGQPIWTLPVYWQGLDIEEIWFNTAGYRQGGTTWDGLGYSAWFGYWRQLFETYKRGGYSVNPFINTPLVLFTYFGAVDTYGWTVADSKDILEYCELKLYTSDLSLDYTWVNKSFVCATALDILSGSLHNIVDGSWNILKWYNIVWERRLWTNGSWNSQGIGWVGAWTTWDNYSWNNIVVSDGKTFISEIFWELNNMEFNNLDKSDFWLWVLPSYIILFFLAIVVFRFISH